MLYLAVRPLSLFLDLSMFSWSRVKLKVEVVILFQLNCKGTFIAGEGLYSMWSSIGWGGCRAWSKVRSMTGWISRLRPRAMFDHVFVKCVPEYPSATRWCRPTPSETPTHLKQVTCRELILAIASDC